MPKNKTFSSEATNAAFELVTKKFAEGLVGAGISVDRNKRFIPTGDPALDYILGGGIPRGRVTEIAAQEGAGKTSTALRTISVAQGLVLPSFKCDKPSIFIDAEYALDYDYVNMHGINVCFNKKDNCAPNAMYVYLPPSGEEALDFVLHAIQSNAADLIIIDSKDALAPQSEQDTAAAKGFVKEPQQARTAAMFSRWLRLVTAPLGRSDVAVLIISQLREKVGIVFGNPETTSGGRALKFYASSRIFMTNSTAIKDTEGTIFGRETSIKCIKNKVAPPNRTSSMFAMNNIGIDVWRNTLEKAVGYGVISKNGTFYELDGQKRRKAELLKELREDPAKYEQLYYKVLAKMNGEKIIENDENSVAVPDEQ